MKIKGKHIAQLELFQPATTFPKITSIAKKNFEQHHFLIQLIDTY